MNKRRKKTTMARDRRKTMLSSETPDFIGSRFEPFEFSDSFQWLDSNSFEYQSLHANNISVNAHKQTNKSEDVTLYLSELNRTLELENNQTSGWQKDLRCSIAYKNSFCIRNISTSTQHHPSLPGISIWLAFENYPLTPLFCKWHRDPISSATLRSEK